MPQQARQHQARLPSSAAIARPGTAGALIDVSTDGVPAREKLDFWRDAVLSRMKPIAGAGGGLQFDGQLRRIVGIGADMIEHASSEVTAVRTPQMCARDGVDDISISVMLECDSASIRHDGEKSLSPGTLYLVDYARPVEVTRSRHREASLIISRQQVREGLGRDFNALPPELLQGNGMSAVFKEHLSATLRDAPHMTGEERAVAMDAAVDMAMAALQAAYRGIEKVDTDQFDDGFYRGARGLIKQHCSEPGFDPAQLAAKLGCSRASLYRIFSRHGESVAAAIWATRLESAWKMITMVTHATPKPILLSEIAFRCGFVDQSTFNRMFKRRYGISPSEARALYT